MQKTRTNILNDAKPAADLHKEAMQSLLKEIERLRKSNEEQMKKTSDIEHRYTWPRDDHASRSPKSLFLPPPLVDIDCLD